MRKTLVISFCVVTIVGIVWLIWSFQSKDISVELQGTKYRLGLKNKDYSEPIKVKVNGSLQYSITGERKFRGTIELEGENIPVPADQRELNILLPKEQPGLVIYSYFKDGKAMFYHVGGLFINSDFTRVAFYLYEQKTNDSSDGGGWSGDNGIMLSAPTGNRNEALTISKELMKNWIYVPDFLQ
jgi:hypothetical protein